MAQVKSSLSKNEHQLLLSLFDSVSFTLLYKASVHGYNAANFHYKCDNQGPTLTVGYNNSGYIFGGYTCMSYSQSGGYKADNSAFLFYLKNEDKKSEPVRIPVTKAENAIYDVNNRGPDFGTALQFLYNNSAAIYSNPGNTYTFEPLEFCGNDFKLRECEVYRVELIEDLLEKPWRSIQWKAERKKELMNLIMTYKPTVTSVSQVRVLLVGPIGAGKSSFFNSINSVFRGHVTSQAIAGCAVTSVTKQFRTYSIKAGREGKQLPIVLCDTMGLEEVSGAGVCVEDIANIAMGNIPDRYQFNPSAPIHSKIPGCIKSKTIKDKIHCVAFVIDACKVKIMPSKLEDKLLAIREKLNLLGVPQLVLLTKVDEACPLVAEDIRNVYRSRFTERKIQEVGARLGVPVSCIVPIQNYSRELELDDNVNILLLSAIIQMLRFADNYFDDISYEEMNDMDTDSLLENNFCELRSRSITDSFELRTGRIPKRELSIHDKAKRSWTECTVM
ncbi:interferon-induced protein 44-like isoform X1 [Polypterus senegalus]|uniref:interferon-induced protein 44-like isoform X1 n=1 Tax=Polypterus senegalus TaxID=55291 RepID=UPI0019646755|nr:interferon-induced protein 44-like isoform X1 [Polypterus senegalus]XP_039607897.1 interferon-induced protein 44-like isoform X1 [Polypterus senegalus]